ncbi:MOSC domain-containing protein [Aestuariibaculum marinum]|uniref:MOSC domain-containing protein n=1 Tax=Aestuariibaculum marinum TaxID=2683592 RepID=A0A8J6Q5X7_9FLAO|nr:MOSC domain-containing protein [Aestuariibaculum marinum]MBD0825422.1 MOSC domain-containing protein [Aestuariibaculum marinum]
MQVIATNIATPTTIIWKNKQETTGIYKTPTTAPIFLGKSDVKNDSVIDRKYHGGEFKACYLFSENEYDYWKSIYPNLDWTYGMFGENITVKNLDESEIFVGDIYKVGEATVQITEPREPCWKLGVKFGSQDVLKQFIERGFSGTYIRVLKEGYVTTGDIFQLIERDENSISVYQFFDLLYNPNKNQEWLNKIIKSSSIPEKKREKLKGFINP